MARNVYFSQGTKNEQYMVEDIIIESMQIYGQDLCYIPRTLVSKDEILGEDRLSEFKNSFPIEMYFENIDAYEGQGAFIQKFGLMMEQSATLVVSRRRWEQLVGRFNKTIIPTRPCEGDLIYFPMTKAMFEIKFVKHQDPFYQIGKLYVYKLQVELFQYASERITTGDVNIDVFESLNTLNTTENPNYTLDVDNQGNSFGDNNKFKTEAIDIVFSEQNPFGEIDIITTFSSFTSDSTSIKTDSTIITVDKL